MMAELIPSHYDEKVRSRLIAGAEKALKEMNIAFEKESDYLQFSVFDKIVYLIPSHQTKFFQDYNTLYIFFNNDKNLQKTINLILFKTKKNGFEMINEILKILNMSVSHISVEYDATKIRLHHGVLLVLEETNKYQAKVERAFGEFIVSGRIDAILKLIENLNKLNRKEVK